MNKMAWTAALAALGMLSACSSTPNCLKTQRYTDAKSFPPLTAPPGMDVPRADDEMDVPDVRSGPISAYAQAPQGTDAGNPQSRCLTTPPPIQG